LGGQADHRLDQIQFQQFLANLALNAAPEERPLRQHHGHTACDRGHGLDHVLHKGKIATAIGGQPGKGTAPRVAFPDYPSPLFQRERWIGEHTVMGRQAAGRRIRKAGLAQGVALHDGKIINAMQQQQVHARDGGGSEILFLAVAPPYN